MTLATLAFMWKQRHEISSYENETRSSGPALLLDHLQIINPFDFYRRLQAVREHIQRTSLSQSCQCLLKLIHSP